MAGSNWREEPERKRAEYREAHNLPKIENYGFSKDHDPRSVDIYNFISETDFANGDAFCFKKGGDGDNGEALMDLLDAYWKQKCES